MERDGAVVGGINAQNNGSAPEVPAAAHQSPGNTQTVAGEVFSVAVLSCRNATATTVRVTNQTGTPADITAWSHQAAAPAQELRTNAAALRDAVNLGHPGAVASAANSLCSVYPAVAAVPPMPDAAGSQAWSAAVTSFSTAATQSLQAVLGNPNAKSAALDALAKGEQELNAMSARINSVA